MKKLKNKSGETLVETLVALLISCLAMAALSTAMTSAGRIMSTAEERLGKYYAQNEILSNPGTETGTSGKVTVLIANGAVEEAIALAPEYDEEINVYYYSNTEATGGSTVTAYYRAG